jgi:hypothetical protein
MLYAGASGGGEDGDSCQGECSTLPGDTTLDYPLYYACRYYDRLSALPIIRSALSFVVPEELHDEQSHGCRA